MDMDVEKVVRDEIEKVLHFSLATCANNIPWSCEVHFVYDKDLNIYFRSSADRRHSKEISENSRVAGTIVKQYEKGVSCIGVYFEGNAEMVEEYDNLQEVVEQFESRHGASNVIEDARQDSGHKIYKISVINWYVFGRFGGSSGKKYQLEWNK